MNRDFILSCFGIYKNTFHHSYVIKITGKSYRIKDKIIYNNDEKFFITKNLHFWPLKNYISWLTITHKEIDTKRTKNLVLLTTLDFMKSFWNHNNPTLDFIYPFYFFLFLKSSFIDLDQFLSICPSVL